MRNFQRINVVSFKEDSYLAERLSKFQSIKGDFSRVMQGGNNHEIERILEDLSVLIQDLRGYEMVMSQKPILNDWMENEYLLHKALPLNMKIGDLVHQIQSADISDEDKYEIRGYT